MALVKQDMSNGGSPADELCQEAQSQNMECEVSPTKFTAELVVIGDATGQHYYLAIEKDGKIVDLIPVQ